MSNYKTSSWQKFLAPLVAALIALCGAGAAYLKSKSEITEQHDIEVTERAKVQMQVNQNREDISVLKADNALMKSTLYQIGNDVSFIRGKMEAEK